ncbi:MAG: glycosyltransferase family 9 protein, partial [Bacteroidota bacterium]
ATKRLTEAQISQFCATFGHAVVLLGGPGDREVGERIAAANTNTSNACGHFSLGGSADLLRQATVVVTHDTGLMHIAAALRKPIISVWGNTVPNFGMYPYLPGQEELEKTRRQEVLDLPCRPCSKIGFQACPKGHFQCITGQDPAALASFAASLLRDG